MRGSRMSITIEIIQLGVAVIFFHFYWLAFRLTRASPQKLSQA